MAPDRGDEGLVDRLRRRDVAASRELFRAYMPAAWSYCTFLQAGLPVEETVERALVRSLTAIREDPARMPDLDATVLRSLRESSSGRIAADHEHRLHEAERAFRRALPATIGGDPARPPEPSLAEAQPRSVPPLGAVLLALLALVTLAAVLVAAALVMA